MAKISPNRTILRHVYLEANTCCLFTVSFSVLLSNIFVNRSGIYRDTFSHSVEGSLYHLSLMRIFYFVSHFQFALGGLVIFLMA